MYNDRRSKISLIIEGLHNPVNEGVKPKKRVASPRDEFSLRKKSEEIWTDADTQKFKDFGASANSFSISVRKGAEPKGAEVYYNKQNLVIRKLNNSAYIVDTYKVSNKVDTSKPTKREIWEF